MPVAGGVPPAAFPQANPYAGAEEEAEGAGGQGKIII